jgi:hypothetical protein
MNGTFQDKNANKSLLQARFPLSGVPGHDRHEEQDGVEQDEADRDQVVGQSEILKSGMT